MKRRQCFVSNSSSSSYTIDDSEFREDEDRFLLRGAGACDKVLYLLRKIDEISNMLSFGGCEERHPTWIALDAVRSVLLAEHERLLAEAAARKTTDAESAIPVEVPCPYCEIEKLWDINSYPADIVTYRHYARLVESSCATAPLYRCSGCGKLWQCSPDCGLVEIRL